MQGEIGEQENWEAMSMEDNYKGISHSFGKKDLEIVMRYNEQ